MLSAKDQLKEFLDEYSPWLHFEPSDDRIAAADAETASKKGGLPPKVSKISAAVSTDYIPRKRKDNLTDVQILRRAHEAGLSVLLYGPPGTGKTSMVSAAFPDAIIFPGTAETEVADFVGSYVQNPDGSYAWVDGPLPRAMEEGKPFLVDEVALVDPRVMAVVYSVMDGRDELTITMNPERGTVKAAEGFIVFGACNPDAPGAVMSEALLSRFNLHVEVLTDWSLAKALGIDSKIVTVARNLEKRHESHEIMGAPQLRELLTFKATAEAFGENIALANFISQAKDLDRPAYAEVVSAVYGKTIDHLKV